MVEDWCAWCASYGKTHHRDCAVSRDAGNDPSCTCEPVLCARCRGEGATQRQQRAARFVENITLLHRANKLLKAPLTQEDREFVEDLVRRLAEGKQPKFSDHFCLRELEASYLDSTPQRGYRPKRPLDS